MKKRYRRLLRIRSQDAASPVRVEQIVKVLKEAYEAVRDDIPTGVVTLVVNNYSLVADLHVRTSLPDQQIEAATTATLKIVDVVDNPTDALLETNALVPVAKAVAGLDLGCFSSPPEVVAGERRKATRVLDEPFLKMLVGMVTHLEAQTQTADVRRATKEIYTPILSAGRRTVDGPVAVRIVWEGRARLVELSPATEAQTRDQFFDLAKNAGWGRVMLDGRSIRSDSGWVWDMSTASALSVRPWDRVPGEVALAALASALPSVGESAPALVSELNGDDDE